MDTSPFLRGIRLDEDATLELADLSLASMDDDSSPLMRTGVLPSASSSTLYPTSSTSTSSRTYHSHSHSTTSTSAVPELLVPAPAPAANERAQRKPRFSLFAAGASPNVPATMGRHASGSGPRAPVLEEDEEDEGDESYQHEYQSGGAHDDGDETATDLRASGASAAGPAGAAASGGAPMGRDERLRASLAELRRFNAVFDGFLGALVDAKAHNERLATRVAQTHVLLDHYVALQGQALHTQERILDPTWTGVHDDERALAQAEATRVAAEAARVAEIAAAEQREEEARAEAERRAAAAAASASAGRGGARGGAARGRGTGLRRPAAGGSGTGIPSRLARPTAGTGGTGGTARPTSAGGRYGHVQGSGYGPRRAAQ